MRLFAAAFSPDGARVVTAAADGAAQLWNAATGERIGGPMIHASDVVSASFSADGALLVTGALGLAVTCLLAWLPNQQSALGVIARRQIRRTGESGNGLATAGVVLGSVFTVVLPVMRGEKESS